MRAGINDRAVKAHLLNFVGGQAVHTPQPVDPALAPYVRRALELYEVYPEIPDGELLHLEVKSDDPGVMIVAYGTVMRLILAVANLSPETVQTTLWVPGMGSVLYDRLEGRHVPLAGGLAWMELPGYVQVAYELR